MKAETHVTSHIVELLKAQIPDVRLIYLFGSYAKKQENPESDIDIAILSKTKLDPLFRWDIQQGIADKLNKDIDLIDLLSASTVMQNEIVNNGICLYDSSNERGKFEMQVLSMYQRLNEERAEILSEYIGDK